MSLHAHLSPEAEARLRAQQRNSTISSLLIAVLFLVLVGLVLGFFLLKPMIKEPPVIVTYQSNVTEDNTLEERKVQTSMDRKPSSPSSAMTKVIVSSTVSATSIPVPEVDVSTPSLDFGDGDDFGSGWGSGAGSGGGFSNVPQTMKSRCSPQDRLARLKETGGNEACEAAVVKALQWMQKTQLSDGSWGPAQYKVSMTGLSLLAYLGHCETPQSAEYGETVNKAITFLVNTGLKNDGLLTTSGQLAGVPPVYEHGIATYALAEAYTFCKSLNITIPDLDKVTKDAGDIIIKGQTDQGSWVYGYASTGGDNSVGFWQIQALKACKHTGLWTDSKFNPIIRKAHDWLEEVQGPNGAIGYRNNPATSPQLTAGAVLCFQLWDKGSSKGARNGLKYLSKNSEFKWGDESSNLYYSYYLAQAMMNEGGSDWEKYNNKFRDSLVGGQKSDGSWDQRMKHGPVNVHMATCLATLMLEVYYRFLPGTGSK